MINPMRILARHESLMGFMSTISLSGTIRKSYGQNSGLPAKFLKTPRDCMPPYLYVAELYKLMIELILENSPKQKVSNIDSCQVC